ncbi:phosphatidylglycerophosphatase [Fibrobacterales bacterium]|nr:phosphatidylglycerophosphatase [Fibrobacterales bacterium]
MIKIITDYDIRFFHFWRRHQFSAKVDSFLRFYTRLGDGYVWTFVVAFLYFFYGFDFLIEIIKKVIPAIFISLALYWLVKLSTRRKRPFDLLKEVRAAVPPLDKYSFPSGHTMNNLAAGFVIFNAIPHIGAVMILMPLTWGLLRVYYGVHWLSDVVVGAILGFASFYLSSIVL